MESAVACRRSSRRVEPVGRRAVRALRAADGEPRASGGGAPRRARRDEEKPLEFVDDDDYLRSLDPKRWKEQDHYAVLGLVRSRHAASDDDVKRAYRRQALRHHPDKRRALGERVRTDDDYFACVTRAYEVLGEPRKRRSYDSVDPHNDDSLPSAADVADAGFFDALRPAFEANARWSERAAPPPLGDDETPREAVDDFYRFWYDFDSWRDYSYEDEEEKEKGQDRDERRWIEKQNRVVRAKKKKEEMARIRALVDLAYEHDPRIARFKREDKHRKLAAKQARQDAARARKAEEDRQMKETQIAKENAEKEERAKADSLRMEKELVKKQMKKERKIFRDVCKSNDYYVVDDSERVDHMSAVEKICEVLKLLELQQLNRQLPDGGRDTFVQMMNETEQKLEAEREAQFETQKNDSKLNSSVITAGSPVWTPELVHMLIKSVNFFPAGTNQRWEIIANFINQHGIFEDHRRFCAKDVLNKAKDLQNSDFSKNSLKVAANKEAFDKFEKEKKKTTVSSVDDVEISRSFDNVNTQKNGSTKVDKLSNNGNKMVNGDSNNAKKVPIKQDEKEDLPWSKVEQELLEQAIKTYPVNTPERWDRIAECIPNRSKKDCMKRFKELVDLVKAKKAAAQSVNK